MIMNKLILWSNVDKFQASGRGKLGRGQLERGGKEARPVLQQILNYFINTNR